MEAQLECRATISKLDSHARFELLLGGSVVTSLILVLPLSNPRHVVTCLKSLDTAKELTVRLSNGVDLTLRDGRLQVLFSCDPHQQTVTIPSSFREQFLNLLLEAASIRESDLDGPQGKSEKRVKKTTDRRLEQFQERCRREVEALPSTLSAEERNARVDAIYRQARTDYRLQLEKELSP